ncbi:MAG: ABC transporter permease, partial [Candidatus Hodarchaeales archaeon]
YKFQKEDISSDQNMYYILSALILMIAAFGTFNLISRVVTSQRRQIGINMALGVPPHKISLRYLILALEIVIGGVIFGLVLAILIGDRFSEVISHIIPYPVWKEWLVLDRFFQGALIGIIIPFMACLIPVWRATQVHPIEAIYIGSTLSTGKGVPPILERIHFPGKIFYQLPFRNLSRNVRRTFSTIFGVALAISVLVAVFGFLDGGNNLLLKEQEIIEGRFPNRIDVTLNNFYNSSQAPVTTLMTNTKLQHAEVTIQIPGRLISSRDAFTIGLKFLDFNNDIWFPKLLEEAQEDDLNTTGIILPLKAANDLKVGIGDFITVEHLFRESDFQYSERNSSLKVVGIYNSQVRFWAFINIKNSDLINCTGLVNSLMVVPKSGVSFESIQADFFQISGFNKAQTARTIIEVYNRILDMFTSILEILKYIVMALAFLIAFNTVSINIDERKRELATMGAFGTPIRTTSWMLMLESFVVGIFGTILGFFPLGYIVSMILQMEIDKAFEEIKLSSYLLPDSINLILMIGIVLVTLTPLITIRKVMQMDLPSALRVVE